MFFKASFICPMQILSTYLFKSFSRSCYKILRCYLLLIKCHYYRSLSHHLYTAASHIGTQLTLSSLLLVSPPHLGEVQRECWSCPPMIAPPPASTWMAFISSLGRASGMKLSIRLYLSHQYNAISVPLNFMTSLWLILIFLGICASWSSQQKTCWSTSPPSSTCRTRPAWLRPRSKPSGPNWPLPLKSRGKTMPALQKRKMADWMKGEDFILSNHFCAL